MHRKIPERSAVHRLLTDMAGRAQKKASGLREVFTATIFLGPAHRTAANWKLAPRPAENVDAAEVSIVRGPASAELAANGPASRR